MLRIALIITILYSYITVTLAAESNPDELQGWYFSIEQDLFYLFDPDKNEDRDYTMGLSFTAYSCPDSANPFSFFSPHIVLKSLSHFFSSDSLVCPLTYSLRI